MELFVILFLYKLYDNINIFMHIEEKYGQLEIKLTKIIKKQHTKITKIKCDVNYLLYCKRHGLIPHFARPKSAVKINKYLRDKIGRQILDADIRNKHRIKKRSLQQVKHNTDNLTNKIGFITKLVLYQKIKVIMKKEETTWSNTHKKKLDRLQSEKLQFDKIKLIIIENVIYNFSSYKLSSSEEYPLSFSLDQHIPGKFNKNKTQTEFENFYHHVLQHTKDLDQESQDELKSKIRGTCENYSKIKIPYQQQKVINNLSNNKSIILIKQDKGRGIVILGRNHYTEKCLSIVESKLFRKLEKDSTKTLESKVRRTLRKIKNVLSEDDYKKLYHTGSRSGLFYGTAKVHKLQSNQGLNELTVRPMLSNIGTATCETAKYLNNLLSPLRKSQHTVLNSKEFVEKIKVEIIPIGYKMISFDVKFDVDFAQNNFILDLME